ncbi:kinase domain protein [Aspergillus campestris IBT 28561]|uniref:Kinase domain protein n=1 Tax=Aspergillus campestris (strain IBT 28561) TaxID=1392248 RepID=A0A2I1DGX2_ASPC2|nr:kinase domain protein [Aspergillus campestris IBT 28561]PKY09121.1 kinase domain protein [Aspergillus campestris IBT 28561]
MASRLSAWGNPLRQQFSLSRRTPNVSYSTLPLGIPLEEETLPYYKPEHYYTVNIRDVYEARYQVSGKIGYGAYSTSWLCRDLQENKYKILKVSTSLPTHPTATDRELKIYEHLANVNSSHPGQSLIRELYDSIVIQGPVGKHRCLVLQPMHMTLLEMMRLNPRPFDLPLLKMTVKRLLLALDFLHTDAEIIHTDLKTDNLMLSLEDDSMLADFAKAEAEDPSPRKKVHESHIIYQRLPILCDFGEARIGKRQESGPFVQPHIYRAPEIIFEMPWGSPVDIWNLAGLIWDLFEGEHLFGEIFDRKGGHDPFKHLALMVALIGPPPQEFIRRSETTEQCFDPRGAWVAHDDAAIPLVSLESVERRLSGQEKASFIQFMRSMLKWLPEERKTAKQLLEDPWLL